MDVDRIYSRNVVSVPCSANLGEAAARMKRSHVGALLVTEDAPNDNRAIGIVTDRDLVLYALAEGIGPTEASVEDVMTRGLATVPRTANLYEVAEVMRASGVRRLGVSDADGTLVGVVSMDDMVDAIAAEFISLAGALRVEREREQVREFNRAPFSG